MKKIVICILIVFVILLKLHSIEGEKFKKNLSYDEYVAELDKDYGNDKKKILDKINKEISDNKNSKEYIGINLLARQYYFYVWIDNEGLIKYADEAEKYLRKYNMEEELLIFYSLMSSRYIGSGKYDAGYIYIDKGESIAKKMYEKNESKEILSTLIAIKYLKAVIGLEIGMENEAEIAFKEAEELRNKGIRERVDIYTNILLYYQNKKEYDLLEEYANKLIRLVEDKYQEHKIYKRDYTRAKIILAESYIYTDEINKSIEIAKELSNNEDLFNDKIYIDELYCLYSKIYDYYGETQESIKYLKMAYDKIKNTYMKSAKIRIIDQIIEQLESIDDKEELLHWYKIESEVFKTVQSLIDTQYFLSEIIDADLENANYSINMLQIQKSRLKGMIITLSIIMIITIITVILDKNRKKLLKENISILEKNIIINQKYYENIKINSENIKRIKHDIKNHLIAINKLVSEKDYENAVNYIKSIEQEIDYSSININTNNKIIDAIISSKIELCNLEGIDLDLDIKIPEKIEVEDFDICVIYGNLLDNAIEACRQFNECEINKYIKLKSIVKGDYLFIYVENSYNGNVNIAKGKFITNKKDKNNHGLGIKNIKKSIKKYDGEMKINYEDRQFQVSIMLNIII